MQELSSRIHYFKLHRARKKQKQTALHLLAVSGVIRPGHVELRYETPIAGLTAFRTQPTEATPQPAQATHTSSAPSWEQHLAGNITATWRHVRDLSATLIELGNKPVLPQWNKQVDL